MKNPLENENAQPGQKSGQEVAKNSAAAASTHGSTAKLKKRIQENTRIYYGKGTAPQYLIRIQCRRHREWFELGADLDAAVKLARETDQHIRLHGWDASRKKYKPAFAAERSDLTVGRFIELVGQHSQLDPSTAYTYASRLRRIVSGIRRLKFGGADKFAGGPIPSKWRMAVDSTLLNTITPEQISTWRDAYVGRHPSGSEERTHAEHTVNGILRNARALFAKRVLKRVLSKCSNLALPSPLPFEGVEFIPERESDYFYTSEVDAKQLIEDAFKELSGNHLLIFVLAIGAGLRRNEIDKLPWAHVDLPTGTVTIAPTKYGRLKSDSSVGKIQLEPRFAEVLSKHAVEGRGEFVLTSHVAPRIGSLQRHYRCKKDFTALCAWLKSKGITRSTSRVHTLRKEFGSHIAQRRGIFAASSGLRHSTIGVTRKFYVSSKIEPTSFFSTEAALPPAQDAAQLMELLRKALEQGALKTAASQPAA
jgi:integrase